MMEDIALASPIGGRPLWEDLGETEDLFEVIDGFAVLRLLGVGGMGQVFLARQLSTGREVALKLLRTTVSVARFRQEVATLAKLDHPGVVPVLHAGEHRGRPYFAMEYVAGANLIDRMRVHAFSPREAVGILVSVARAIQHAHERGVLHRDIKPQNILITGQGVARVTDFGLARWMDADVETLTTTGIRVGTPAYMAPEQVSGDRGRQGAATDVYGLGATLYHLLAGVAPFRGEHVDQIYHQILEGEPVGVRLLNEKVDRDLESVVLACLEKDPARRYATAGLLADDLERWLAAPPFPAMPVGWRCRITMARSGCGRSGRGGWCGPSGFFAWPSRRTGCCWRRLATAVRSMCGALRMGHCWRGFHAAVPMRGSSSHGMAGRWRGCRTRGCTCFRWAVGCRCIPLREIRRMSAGFCSLPGINRCGPFPRTSRRRGTGADSRRPDASCLALFRAKTRGRRGNVRIQFSVRRWRVSRGGWLLGGRARRPPGVGRFRR